MRSDKLLLSILLTFLIFGCASAPDGENIIPDWYMNPPSDNNEFLYFTVSAQASILKDIEKLAGEIFYKDFTSSLGMSEEDSMLDDLTDFRKDISGILRDRKVPGFTLIEKQINHLGSENVLYALIELRRENLEEVEDTLAEVLKAGSSATIYSDQADEYLENGEIYNSALYYIKAALESAESANSFITEKNLSSAIEQLRRIYLKKMASPLFISVGKNGIFSASLNIEGSNEDFYWEDSSVKVTFRDRKKGSIIGDRFAELRSDLNGLITFVHPSPGFTGEGRVDISLDLFRDTGSLDILEENHREKLIEIRKVVESAGVVFDFDIISSAPSVPTGILIVDSDFLRKPLSTSNTAEGMFKSLSDGGFSVTILSDVESQINKTELEFLRDIPYMVGSDIKRVIFGVAQITEFDDSAAGFTVVTEAEVKVINVESGEILFAETLSKRVQGGESQATINTSFKELGKSFSALLIDKLP